MHNSSAAPRVVRGWIAASVCSWTAFAAHAQATPTAASAVVMLLITCISAVIAMALLGRKINLLTTSLVALASQGMYHFALSVMSHPGAELVATTGTGAHAHHVTALGVTNAAGAPESNSMVLAHLLAAVVSIFILRQGERMAVALVDTLSLATVRRILAVLHLALPLGYKPAAVEVQQHPFLSRDRDSLPLLRGPPSTVLIHA